LGVRGEKASSFGFSALALRVGKNQMCLTERGLFLYAAQLVDIHKYLWIFPLSAQVLFFSK